MSRRRSMRFQTSVIIIVSFLLSHAAGYLFYELDRRSALEMTEAIDIAERAAGVSRLVRDLSESARAEVVRFSDSRAFRVWASTTPAFEEGSPSQDETDVLSYLRTQVPRIANNDMRVRFNLGDVAGFDLPEFSGTTRLGSPASAEDVPKTTPSIAISIKHGDADWINFLGVFNTPPSLLPELLVANILSAVIGIALVAFWLVSRVTRPLSRLSAAAERLGQDIDAEPIDTSGPEEVATAAEAFNRMQRRLARLLRNRTELLAAISHDLRTPLTQIRLRTELMPVSREQEKTLQAVDEIETMLGSFLTYAHAVHGSEQLTRSDLGALVTSLCDDLLDCGAAITCDAERDLILPCKRLAMKRALTNIIDNALKYGHEARVVAFREGDAIKLTVDDCGPGIAEAQIDAVFAPFFRGRSDQPTEKNGVGLGLNIAQLIVEDHGGEIRLCNRKEGGLRAEIRLPC